MIARVRLVTAAAAASGSRLWVIGSMSANTGVAPVCTIVFAVAQNVSGVVTTSSCAPMPDASSDRCSAAVHELTAMACGAPTYAANACSKAATRGPVVSQPDSSVAITSAISSGPMDGGAKATGADVRVVLMGRVPTPGATAIPGVAAGGAARECADSPWKCADPPGHARTSRSGGRPAHRHPGPANRLTGID